MESTDEVYARELDTLSPDTPASPSRFKLYGPRAKPNLSRGRAASFQVQSNASIKGKRRHTLVLEPRSLPPIPAEVSEGRPASAEELEAAKWRDEVVKLMLTAEGHKEIHEGLERFRQQGMPSLTTSSSPQPGIPNLVTCTLPSVCSCGPCLRAERQRNNNALPNVVSPLY